MQQPDFSQFVIHFTKDAPPYEVSHNQRDTLGVAGMPARDRLMRILDDRVVKQTHMPWSDMEAVCFTECTWPSLLQHCDRYSPYGIGFSKSVVFAAGGGPAIYIRDDHFAAQRAHRGFTGSLYSMLTPFRPSYGQPTAPGQGPIDFTHEREWRLPGSLTFTDQDVAFLVVASHEDVPAMGSAVTARFPSDKWVIISAYREIEKLWPQHHV